MAQPPDQRQRVAELEADVTLLARAVGHLLRVPGREGRWSRTDFAVLADVLERRDPAEPA